MMILWIIFLPMACAVISWLIGKKSGQARDIFVILAAFAELALTLLLPRSMPSLTMTGFLVTGLSFTTDGFRVIYSLITAVMWAGTTLFAREYFKEERAHLNRYWFFVLFTLGATQGVMLSADLFTAFLFFEILSFTSFTWVIHEETPGAIRAAYTYLFIAVIGGLVLFMGLLLVYQAAGTLSFRELGAACAASGRPRQILAGGICILTGFGAKAGMFPVHVWLPKAHPVAPSPASALLSGILTKVGVYGILMTTLHALCDNRTYGLLVLCLGVITMALGAVLALFSVNLKRTLACSSMSQIGFILTGTGMTVLLTAAGEEEGVSLALSGVMLHMVNHSLLKLTLFMAAGVVVMNLHELNLNRIRGWGRNKWALKIPFALGLLGISGVPGFNGYISKTMLHEGIVEGIHACPSLAPMLHVTEWIFLISGGCTFAYMLKLFLAVFVEKNTKTVRTDDGEDGELLQTIYDRNRRCMNPTSFLAVFGSSLAMIVLGQPRVMTRLAAYMTGKEAILEFRAFSMENLKGGLISLGIGLVLYLFAVRLLLMKNGEYLDLWPEKLDLENAFYRPLLTKWLPFVFGNLASVFGENKVLTPLAKAVMFLATFAGRVLVTSTDAVIVFLRATVLRERSIRLHRRLRAGTFRVIRQGTEDTISAVTQNFSFALAMTCLGIVLILAIVVLAQ